LWWDLPCCRLPWSRNLLSWVVALRNYSPLLRRANGLALSPCQWCSISTPFLLKKYIKTKAQIPSFPWLQLPAPLEFLNWLHFSCFLQKTTPGQISSAEAPCFCSVAKLKPSQGEICFLLFFFPSRAFCSILVLLLLSRLVLPIPKFRHRLRPFKRAVRFLGEIAREKGKKAARNALPPWLGLG